MLRILAQESQGSNPYMFVVMMGAMIMIFYFLLIRPQRKQEARRRAMIEAIRKNDRILTNGGILGVVTNVKDDEVTVRVDDARDVKIRITKTAISAVLNKEEEEG